MKLHYVPVSGNSYKVRILLSLLKVPYEKVIVDTKGGAHKRPAFRAAFQQAAARALTKN